MMGAGQDMMILGRRRSSCGNRCGACGRGSGDEAVGVWNGLVSSIASSTARSMYLLIHLLYYLDNSGVPSHACKIRQFYANKSIE
jgi:hypothetical protein